MTDDRLIDIEIKLAHQEKLIDELNQVLTDQEARITALEARCKTLADRVRSLGDAGASAGAADDERPPHY